jgi:phage baseplate assembly protein gpV
MDPLKLVRNIVRVGRVNTIDEAKGTVQVLFQDRDNLISGDLPLLNFEYHMPDIGDQVVCIFLGNGIEQGYCLGSFYSNVSPTPVANKNIYKKKIDDNVNFTYNKVTKSLEVNVESVQIHVQNGKATIKANEILLGDGATEGTPLGKTLKEWLDNHTHEYSWTDTGGSGTTGKPSPSPQPSTVVKVK